MSTSNGSTHTNQCEAQMPLHVTCNPTRNLRLQDLQGTRPALLRCAGSIPAAAV
jgi:hypothetical protein